MHALHLCAWLLSDEYVQSQLIVSALSITTTLLKDGGSFICKIFRGRDINVLYTKLEVLFHHIAVAKPKSSRNSSIEAFVVCQGFHAQKGVDEQLDPHIHRSFGPQKTIRFVACGDLSAYDADSNYPLLDGDEYIEPVQPPTNPNYKELIKMKQVMP